jgi:hypothetical protein
MSGPPSKLASTLKKLGVSLGSIVFLLLLLEVGFRIFDHDTTLTLDLDSELYWFPRPDQTNAMTRINTLGLRGPETKEKDPSKFRFLATGDSFTYGDHVTNDESWPIQLNVLLGKEGATHPGDSKPVEVLNGGGPGWGIFQMDRYLRRSVPRFEPNVVFWTITPIDIYRQPFSEKELAQYMKLQQRRKLLRDTSAFLTFMARRVARLQTGKRAVPNERPAETADKNALWAADSDRIRKFSADFSGKTKLVLLVLQDFSKEHDWVAEHAKALATELKVDYFDLAPAYIGADKNVLHVPGDGHPNREGHAITAKALADMMCDRALACAPGAAPKADAAPAPAP